MDDLEDTIKGIFALVIGVGVFIIIGQQFHWFDWVGPTLKVIWLIIKIILGLALVAGIIWIIYYIKNKPRINAERRKKEAERQKIIELGKKRREELEKLK